MLEMLGIENFKCFKKQYIPLSPLTLLTGFNAAGKSTSIQSILLGGQMARLGDCSKGVSLNGDLVRLGTIGEVLCHSADEREIRFEYQTSDSKATINLDASDRSKRSLGIKANSTLKDREEIVKILRNIIVISAIRGGTLDIFPSPEGIEPVFSDVGECGQFAPWWFEQYSDIDISIKKAHQSETALTLHRQFIAWANEIFPGSQANTEQIERTPYVRLELRTGLQEEWKRPANIGYGLTYAFPIIVAGLLSKAGQMLIIDSPEAHLHPRGQSKMGYFLGVVAAAGVQVVVETHSDHILNGIRLAVAKKAIANDDVAIHFFSSIASGTVQIPQITSPRIDTDGNLSEWPVGFFDQTDKDLSILRGWE